MESFYIISFDLEATGLSTQTAGVCEIGMHISKVKDTTIIDVGKFSDYCKPYEPMSEKASEITKLTNEFLSTCCRPSKLLQDFADAIDKHCTEDMPRVLVSYNGHRYDIPLLTCEVERNNMDALTYFRKMKISYSVDVLNLARKCLSTSKLQRKANGNVSYKLGDVYKSLVGKELSNAHNASYDAYGVVECIMNSCELLDGMRCSMKQNDECVCNLNSLVSSVLEKKNKKRKHQTVFDMVAKKKRKKDQDTTKKTKTHDQQS